MAALRALLAGAAFDSMVLPFEGHALVVEPDEARVGDGDAMGVAGEIGEDSLRSWSAANKLWSAWFKPDPMVSDKLARWKAPFERADDPHLQPLRSYIRRVLSSKAATHADLEKKIAPNPLI